MSELTTPTHARDRRADRNVPAAGRAAFTGLYDAVVALTMREHQWPRCCTRSS
jgi:hypothetical protein